MSITTLVNAISDTVMRPDECSATDSATQPANHYYQTLLAFWVFSESLAFNDI